MNLQEFRDVFPQAAVAFGAPFAIWLNTLFYGALKLNFNLPKKLLFAIGKPPLIEALRGFARD